MSTDKKSVKKAPESKKGKVTSRPSISTETNPPLHELNSMSREAQKNGVERQQRLDKVLEKAKKDFEKKEAK